MKACQKVYKEIFEVVFKNWPQTLIPNKLVSSLRDIRKTIKCKDALLEELAADIFMGDFSSKYSAVAQLATEKLQDLLYGKYYGLKPFAKGHLMDELTRRQDIVDGKMKRKGQNWCAANGAIIEECQIVTSHNLVVIFEEIEFANIDQMARKTMEFILKNEDRISKERHMRKDCAYAWRQMVFYLSMCEPETIIHEGIEKAKTDMLRDYFKDLRRAANGEPMKNLYFKGWMA